MTSTSFAYRYASRSGFLATPEGAHLGLATNTLREATYFEGVIADPIAAREGLAGLYSVVTSDLRYRPRDRSGYLAWVAEQEREFLANLVAKRAASVERVAELNARVAQLDAARIDRRRDFDKAREAYVRWAIEDELERSVVLDPVVTVHPDELSFEAFSKDQSSYARLAIGFDAFREIGAFACGTTNIDYSRSLHLHFERLRSYRNTRLTIRPTGIGSESPAEEVGSKPAAFEKTIPLPDGWLEGFLQVHALMSMGLERVELDPIDVENLLAVLRRRRAKTSPRALAFELAPGARTSITVEPFGTRIGCGSRSILPAGKARTVRIWGRDRLHVLTRLLPRARRVQIFLAGTGLPTVWVLDLGGSMSFTLALSGWTDNDWIGGETKLDLLTRRAKVSRADLEAMQVHLQQTRRGTTDELAVLAGLPTEVARSALSLLAQAGRAMFDITSGLHRYRSVVASPFSASEALALGNAAELQSSPQAPAAAAIHASGGIRIIARRPFDGGLRVSGISAAGSGAPVRPRITLDHEGQLVEATCTCPKGLKDGLVKGPCEHVLSLRLAAMQAPTSEDSNTGSST